MALPLVSVVIPAYNVSRFVRESVDSALSQTHPAVEVIVINDGSTDDTGAILTGYGDRIVYVKQQNQGLSAARNVGMRKARGEYIAFLDSDDAWFSEKTTEQLAVFTRSSEIGLVSSRFRVMDEHSTMKGDFVGGPTAGCPDLEKLLLGNAVGPPSCVMLRRECFERVGFFDEALVNGSEDWDYYLRVLFASWRIELVERPLTKYRLLSNSMSSAKNADRMLQNDLMVLDKAFAHPEIRHNVRLQRRARSARHFAAAWHYIEVGDERLTDLRRAVVRSFLLYPVDFVNRPHLMVTLHALLGDRLFSAVKAPFRRLVSSAR